LNAAIGSCLQPITLYYYLTPQGAFHLTSTTLACIISSLFDIRLQRRWNDARERCGR